jgi:hypothetical protein
MAGLAAIIPHVASLQTGRQAQRLLHDNKPAKLTEQP